MCRFLLDFHASIRLKDINCWTALHHAVYGDFYDTATLLIKRGSEMNVEDHRFGRTPLHLAAEKGFSKMAEMLIIRGADLYASGDAAYSKTALHIACIHNHLETIDILIRRGANVEALSGLIDMTPLHITAQLGHTEAARILLHAGALVNAMGTHVRTPFCCNLRALTGRRSMAVRRCTWPVPTTIWRLWTCSSATRLILNCKVSIPHKVALCMSPAWQGMCMWCSCS